MEFVGLVLRGVEGVESKARRNVCDVQE
jgi:hypothetical protein